MTRGAAWIIAAALLAALLAPSLAPYDPAATHYDYAFAPPMSLHVRSSDGWHLPFAHGLRLADRLTHHFETDTTVRRPLPWRTGDTEPPVYLLGADGFGRDVLSRLLYGTRTSLAVALAATLGALVIGTTIGAWAGYRGGWPDDALMRMADVALVLPAIQMVLVLRALSPLVLPASTVALVMVAIFAVVGWPMTARGIRAIVMAESRRDFVEAARAAGATPRHIIVRHLLPACARHLVVQATLLLPTFILAEATLSFVGLGFPEATPSWGTMLAAATPAAMARFPWLLSPALAIFTVVLAANASLGGPAVRGWHITGGKFSAPTTR